MSNSSGNPMVVPAENFNPADDALALKDALKSNKKDKLIDIICRRSNEQRQIIRGTYGSDFGKDLIEDIRSENSGNFGKLLVALLTPIDEFNAKELNHAISVTKDDEVLIEVLCCKSNSEISKIQEAYEKLSSRNLKDDLMKSKEGHFESLLVELCDGTRDETGVDNKDAAKQDAKKLFNAGEGKEGTDKRKFNVVFTKKNFAQIKSINEAYKDLHDHSLEKAIEEEFKEDTDNKSFEAGLLAILKCSIDKAQFFANRLNDGKQCDELLIRLIVTRSEIDLKDIIDAFDRMHGSLLDWIEEHTSDYYKRALLKLCG